MVRFYVGEITGTTPQTVKIYTDSSTSVDVQVSEGNKWYTYLLPKDKGLYRISGNTVNKLVVKADINGTDIIPSSTVEASFKGSNTSNVTDMSYMFYECGNLTSLDLSSFNTSNVTDMGYMFKGCTNLTSLDLSNFVTSNIFGMYGMFANCTGLTSLDLSRFDTSNVNSMNSMFSFCGGLTYLDLSGWDTSKVTDMEGMFYGCASLTSIRMKGCSEATIKKITDVKSSSATIVTE